MWTGPGSRVMTAARSVIVRTDRPRARCHSTQFSIRSAVLSRPGSDSAAVIVRTAGQTTSQLSTFCTLTQVRWVCQAVQRERKYFTRINLWIRRLGGSNPSGRTIQTCCWAIGPPILVDVVSRSHPDKRPRHRAGRLPGAMAEGAPPGPGVHGLPLGHRPRLVAGRFLLGGVDIRPKGPARPDTAVTVPRLHSPSTPFARHRSRSPALVEQPVAVAMTSSRPVRRYRGEQPPQGGRAVRGGREARYWHEARRP